MQPIRLAFMGFRHGHIFSLYRLAREREDIAIVAACEEDAATRATMATGNVPITHEDYARMLDAVPCDAVAIGDYYGKRGTIAIEALRRGKHVISDKPLCTSLEEYETIARLSREHGLAVGCQLDLREFPALLGLRHALRDGLIGEVHALGFTGQHPLNYGTRPDWYFTPGRHGGTINDIAIHAIDFIPWATDLRVARVNAARAWNARLPQAPQFQDAAQMMLTLNNGAGVLGDVSYLVPESFGYTLPQYWRITCWGTAGVVEGGLNTPTLLYRNGADTPEILPPPATSSGAYLTSFTAQIRGESAGVTLSTADVLEATRVTLTIQHAADHCLTEVTV